MLPGVNSHVKTVEAGRPSENDQEMDGAPKKEGWEVTLFFWYANSRKPPASEVTGNCMFVRSKTWKFDNRNLEGGNGQGQKPKWPGTITCLLLFRVYLL